MENHALNAAHEIVKRLADDGFFDEGVLNYDETVTWVANIIATEFNTPLIGFLVNEGVSDVLEFGEGDGTAERLHDEW